MEGLMSRLITIFGLLGVISLVGCPEPDPIGDDDDDDDDECANTFTTWPEADAANVYYKTRVEATFDEVETAAELTLTAGGTDVTGTQTWTGNTLSFVPDADLTSETAYELGINFSCGSSAVSFTTGEVGAAVTDQNDLLTKAYLLDLTSGEFIEPPGIGGLLQQYMGEVDVLMGVISIDGTDITMVGAIGVEGANPPEQDVCQPTIDFPVADFSADPFFTVGPEQTTIVVEGFSVTIDDLLISGAFAPDGSYISGAVLSGSVDTRDFVELVDDTGENPGAICDLAAAINVQCEPCSSDSEPYCLSLYVDSMVAAEIDGTITPVLDPCDNPDCAGSSDCEEDSGGGE
jgi:hypothetical protein